MKHLKKVMSLCLVALVLVVGIALLTPRPQAATDGTCGDNLTWTLDSAGTLTISGTGDMYDFAWNTSPWYDRDDITSVIIQSGVTSVGNYAFYLTEIQSAVIGDDVRSIGDHAFTGTRMYDVTIGSSVTTIGNSAFENTRISTVILPDSVIAIGDAAFAVCDNLYHVDIGKGLTHVDPSAFFFCRSVRFFVDADNPTFRHDNMGALLSKDGTRLYFGPGGVQEYTTPEGVLTIGEKAFTNAPDLCQVTVGNSVTTIESGAFAECSNLEQVILGSNVTVIGNRAFDCYYISFNTYDNAQYLGTAENPYYALIQASSTSIAACDIHPDTKVIAGGAFSRCTALKSISIPYGVVSIGDYAFHGCTGLSEIGIPASVTFIGSQAIYYQKIQVDETNPNYSSDSNGVLYNKDKSTLICAPSTVSGHYAVPESVAAIDAWAFYNHDGLQVLTLSDRIASIGENAFAYCDNIQTVYYAGTEDLWNQIAVNSGNTPLTDATVHYNHIHNYDLLPPVITATCTEVGYIEYTCILGDTYRVDAEALGHDYSGAVTTVAPTCTQPGYTTTQCSRCDSVTEPEYTDALGHDYTIAVEVIIPTCTEQGYTIFQCSRCEDTANKNYTNSLGHHPIVIPVCDATCTEQGVTTAGSMCARCKEVFIAPVYTPALGHTFENGICSACREKDPDFVPGDLNGDSNVDNDDVLCLLWYTLFPEENPLTVNGDLTGDGVIANDDVLRLLWHTLFPEQNPLN